MRFAEEKAKIKNYFEGKGFFEIKEDVMDIVVDGVDLELAETATVGKCLFDDFE